jgi:hypothetical protein
MRLLLVCSLLLALCQVVPGRAPHRAAQPITGADTVFAVYTEDWGLRSSGEPQLVLAIWGDGRALWSEDRLRGGAPYRAGQIDPKRLTALLSRLERDGFFANERLSRGHFGPDSQFTTILVRSGKKQLKMASWHELSEAGGTVVATGAGLVPLAGRSRLAVLARESAEYLHYRLAWGELRAGASGLIPSESKRVEGKLRLEAGNLSWEEASGKAEEPAPDKR